jgi:hypothetical protein
VLVKGIIRPVVMALINTRGGRGAGAETSSAMDTSCLVGNDPELSSRSALQILRGLAWNRPTTTLRDALTEATSASPKSGLQTSLA